MMKLIVFNVEQGQCVYIRTPDDHGVLIDCGKGNSGPTASPAQWLADNEAPSLQQHEGHALAALIITHPHEGHTADIDAVNQRLSPAVVCRDAHSDDSALSNLGVRVKMFALSQSEAEVLGGDETSIANNRSIVTLITYNTDEGYTWKVMVAGDNNSDGLEALLAKPAFKDEIAETDFMIAPYHGQPAGFCADLLKATGKPIAIISSTRAQDDRSDSRYRKLAQGVKFPDGKRTDFVTREDGNITVEMHEDGNYDVWMYTPKHTD